MFRNASLSSKSDENDEKLKMYEKTHVVPPFPTSPKWPSGSWISPSFSETYDHEEFEREGFSFLKRFLTKDALEFLRAQVDHVWKYKHPTVQKAWIMNLHQLLPEDRNWVWKLATEPQLLATIEKHLGKHFVLNSAQILVKPPVNKEEDGGRIVSDFFHCVPDYNL